MANSRVIAGRRSGTLVAAGLIVLAAGAAYHPGLSGPFILDDRTVTLENPTIRHLWPLWPVLSPPVGAGVDGRPLLNLSFALNYAVSGDRVWSYHVVNLAIHILAGLTLFGIVRRTLGLTFLAFAIALLWTLHPLQTEAVTYIAERAESLMGLFYLLTVYCFIRYMNADEMLAHSATVGLRSGSRAGFRGLPPIWAALSVACCFLGACTKEVIVTAPVIVLLYDRTFIAGSFREAWRLRWRYYLGLMASWLLLAYLIADLSKRGVGFHGAMSGWSYALTECCVIMRYLGLAFWPHPLVLDYGRFVIRDGAELALCASGLGLLVAGTGYLLLGPGTARRPWTRAAGFWGAWCFLILAPTSSVVPISPQPMAESRMYLPVAGIVVLGAWALHTLFGRRGLAVLLILAVGMGFTSWHRNEIYRSELAIWQDTVAKRPANPRAHNNLGLAFMSAGNPPSAIAQYERALALDPGFSEAENNLGLALAQTGRPAEAIPHYERALRLAPDSAEIRLNLVLGRLDLAAAENDRGNRLVQAGRATEAIGCYEEAVRLEPGDADIHYNFGLALRAAGKKPEAEAQYREALRLKPALPQAENSLGIVLAELGRPAEAVGHFRTALRLRPDYPQARENLGLVLRGLGRAR